MNDFDKIRVEANHSLRKSMIGNGFLAILLIVFFFIFVDGTLAAIRNLFSLINSNFFQVWENWFLLFLDIFIISYALYSLVKLIRFTGYDLFGEMDEEKYVLLVKEAIGKATYPWGHISQYLLLSFVGYNLLTMLIYAIYGKLSPLNEIFLVSGYVNVLSLLPLIVLFSIAIPLNKTFELLVRKSRDVLMEKKIEFRQNLDIEPSVFQSFAIVISLSMFLTLGVMKRNGVLFYEDYLGQVLPETADLMGNLISIPERGFFTKSSGTYSNEQKLMLSILQIDPIDCENNNIKEYQDSISFDNVNGIDNLILKIKVGNIENYSTVEKRYKITKSLKEKIEKFVTSDKICLKK